MFDAEQRILDMLAEKASADISAVYICLDTANALCAKHRLKADYFSASKVFSFRKACGALPKVTPHGWKWNKS